MLTGVDRHVRSVSVFNAHSGKLVTQLLGHTGNVTALAGCAERVWSASGDGSVRGWAPESGQLLRVLTGHEGWVRTVA